MDNIFYYSFSDGYDEDAPKTDLGEYLSDLRRVGSKNLKKLLDKCAGDGTGHPLTCLIYTFYYLGLQKRRVRCDFDLLDIVWGENDAFFLNTFDKLKEKSLKILEVLGICSIGRLLPSAYYGCDLEDTLFGCDLFEKCEPYCTWLDTKPEGSVVYVGSIVVLREEQKEEILQDGRACLEPGRALLEWSGSCDADVEITVAGVPLIGYPQFSDQMTNIKMVEDVWGIGVRARAKEEGIVKREELKRCLEIVMGNGEKGNEIKRNVKKYRDLAMDAMKVGGSSHNNLNKFLESLLTILI
ncbi:putative serine hydroxymethyltransferase 4-like [Capsicum annuum]|nr:putative serine hydroxymethyltransferase 4-like [Capsicum annuum]